MRVFADRLAETLNRQWYGCYLIFGNEPLFVQESRDSIIRHARQLGFEEHHRFSVDSSLDWNDVYDCTQALSLFSSKQIIELSIPESGINAAIAKQLLEISSHLHEDIVVIITGAKLTRAQESAKWFKALNGCLVSCAAPDVKHLPQWVMRRCNASGLKPDGEAIQLLCQWHEGNLFALSQSLEKLSLLYPDGQLNLLRVQESLSRHNHFTVFHWIDAILEGKPKRANRILLQLEAEGIEAVILLRSIQKELQQLIKMQQMLTQSSLNQVFDSFRVWQNKKPLYSAALQRLTAIRLKQAMQLLASIEVQVKTQYELSPWPFLHQLTLNLSATDSSLSLHP
ncbi:DNA polymerase III subunit delta [Vibrio mediterranei]|uniref:DNA polymerase III subunit delta n=1 Tax=Vibrio mediterranei TaxID=689 RepID=A0AAJ3EP56_9VIBR|nr:DNA polymerase III subunit delta [Vibrio mediterranei]ASI90117.1 DNA polymerase III subunit delta [Vibrio mediterranei]MCG9626301.1 DNA polymerase III subunit delta [Vibrio mediterranei]MCG9658744.1 DNA polymerase III subunit delta [Vibrio mediterranei]MCG9664450.1 DNA polymerase III subunit delta [Vibrio mediterranei]NOI24254.1 DNA polymerase III subunit delta [Vibrio mediterranei]